MAATTALVQQLQSSLAIGAADAMARAARQGLGRALPTVVRSLGKALDSRAIPEAQLRSVNQKIAAKAQEAMVSGYRSRLPRRGRSQGELSGTLGSALGSPSMTAGTTARMISFVNTGVLDQSAKHWYRINYGAMGPNLAKAGGQEPRTFTVNINGRPFLTLRDDLPPAPVSWLPRGFFWLGDEFIVTRGPGLPRGKGSRAARFTDLGLQAVANEIGPTYDQFFRTFIADTRNRARLAEAKVKVVADVRVESYGYTVKVH